MDVKARIAEIEKQIADHEQSIADLQQRISQHASEVLKLRGGWDELSKLIGEEDGDASNGNT